MFSRAIQKEGEGCEATKAMCFQNRAASKEVSVFQIFINFSFRKRTVLLYKIA